MVVTVPTGRLREEKEDEEDGEEEEEEEDDLLDALLDGVGDELLQTDLPSPSPSLSWPESFEGAPNNNTADTAAARDLLTCYLPLSLPPTIRCTT